MTGTPARSGGCTRSCSTGRCSPRSPGCTATRPGSARPTPAPAWQALGFDDPAGALRHLEALANGVSRRAAIQRTLLPAMLGWFADAADPDAGLLSFRLVSEKLGSTPWYLRLLRDEGAAAERLAHLLACSRYVADLFGRAPESIAMLADDAELVPAYEGRARPTGCSPWSNATTRGSRPWPPPAGCGGRSCCASPAPTCWGWSTPRRVGRALADSAGATVGAALRVAVRKVEVERRGRLPVRIGIIAMGRLGGHEQGYGSDADVLFVHDPLPGVPDDVAAAAAHAVAEELRRLLQLPAQDPPLLVDADLRPEGRQGPLTRSLAAYREYYARWSHVWEAQALLRAAHLAGDPLLTKAFLELDRPGALARGRPRRRGRAARSGGSSRGSRPSGCPAAPTRWTTSSSGRAACPTSSGPSSCCSCSTPTPCRGCGRPAPSAGSLAAAQDAELVDAVGRGYPVRRPGSSRPGRATR